MGNRLVFLNPRDEGGTCDEISGEASATPLSLKCDGSAHHDSVLAPLHAVAFQDLAGIDDVERLDRKRIVSGDMG